MLKDEFQRLMHLFASGAEGRKVPLEEILRESLTFFARLNEQLKTGDADAQREALIMMKEMQSKITEHMKALVASTGMTEEQLASYSENPGNFSPAEWAAMQETRRQMAEAGEQLVQSVKALDESSRKVLRTSSAAELQAKPKKKSTRRAKRSEWHRS